MHQPPCDGLIQPGVCPDDPKIVSQHNHVKVTFNCSHEKEEMYVYIVWKPVYIFRTKKCFIRRRTSIIISVCVIVWVSPNVAIVLKSNLKPKKSK